MATAVLIAGPMRRAVALVLAALALAAPTAAQGRTTPIEFNGGASEPSLAFDASGGAVALWEGGDDEVFAAAGAEGGRGNWSRTLVLSRGGFEPALATLTLP